MAVAIAGRAEQRKRLKLTGLTDFGQVFKDHPSFDYLS
jgi:hypothetical protein